MLNPEGYRINTDYIQRVLLQDWQGEGFIGWQQDEVLSGVIFCRL
jgi:hypothetical protein